MGCVYLVTLEEIWEAPARRDLVEVIHFQLLEVSREVLNLRGRVRVRLRVRVRVGVKVSKCRERRYWT